MKISKKVFALIMALIMVMGGAADLSAQKRKAAPARKTTTTPKTTTTGKRTTPARTTGPAIDVAESEGTGFQMYTDVELQGKHIDMNSFVVLDENGKLKWDFDYTEAEGTWSVTGNTLKAEANGMRITATSPDGGRSFSGRFQNVTKGIENKCQLFSTWIPKDQTVDKIKTELLDGTYKAAYIKLYLGSDNPSFAIPAKVKFTPGDESDRGTFKVTSDHMIMTALGMIKGEYAFVNNMLLTKLRDDKDSMTTLSNHKGCIYIPLGESRIPGLSSGSVELELQLFP